MTDSTTRDNLRFIYGTAWKEAETQRLTELALQAGFRAIDTANQRRHYDEAAVGQAMAASIQKGLVRREDLFVQTKFTFRDGQDHRLPYDPGAPIARQVRQSFDSSLIHLGIEKIDSFVLHGPTQRLGLGSDDWDAWRAMEAIHQDGLAGVLGVSNVSGEQLERLCDSCRVRPHYVQNRCYAVMGWDRQVRQYCAANGIIYQGFSLLTANRNVMVRPEMVRIAQRHGRTVTDIVFRFALDVGMIPMTGTSNFDHMRADLAIADFQLEPDEVEEIANLALT